MKTLKIELNETEKIYIDYAYDHNKFGRYIKIIKGKNSYIFTFKKNSIKKELKNYINYLLEYMSSFKVKKSDRYYNKLQEDIIQILRRHKITKIFKLLKKN